MVRVWPMSSIPVLEQALRYCAVRRVPAHTRPPGRVLGKVFAQGYPKSPYARDWFLALLGSPLRLSLPLGEAHCLTVPQRAVSVLAASTCRRRAHHNPKARMHIGVTSAFNAARTIARVEGLLLYVPRPPALTWEGRESTPGVISSGGDRSVRSSARPHSGRAGR